MPDATKRINRHLSEELLNDMCREYIECVHAREHWLDFQSVTNTRIREYEQLLAELRAEILAYLQR
ncbi:hypothetical protein [Thalassoroseus pseudoceratinae]|uniref:hypothetical protein n=1 Tax=Thalassoroseus pseudoceratinae TaxID=2713176 RepID=UPI001423F683|nr:hypothetical protein [Thalassoroseus pseudoceratinae]